MGLFHLIEQHHRIGAPPDELSELTPFVVAHVPGRGADEARHAVFLHVLTHVDTHHGARIIEEELRQ